MKLFIGIDNGVTGSLGLVSDQSAIVFKTPVRKVLNYTKKKAFLNRLDGIRLNDMLRPYVDSFDCFALIERPMVNPVRWAASVSAIRCMEATLIVIESLKIPYAYIDSKEWQKALLPAGLEKKELKLAALDVAARLYPALKLDDTDADGLLIAHYAYVLKSNRP